MLHLDNAWHPEPTPAGTWELTLTNLSDTTLADFTLSLTSITRVVGADPDLHNVRFLKRNANFHSFAPPEGLTLAPGEAWTFRIASLNRSPFHRNDAAKTAWVTIAGQHHPVSVGDLMLKGSVPAMPPPRLPEGRLTLPFALLPWPRQIEGTPGPAPVILTAAPGTSVEDRRLMLSVDALHARLFPTARRLFTLTPAMGDRTLSFATADMAPDAYRLDFGDTITLTASADTGRRHGLVTLARMLHGAFADPDFLFPATGHIDDAPRYGWRGCHLDVSRHFWPMEDVLRFVDILAWEKLNIFHWHLADDEAFRAEILALPEMTKTGVTRGPDRPDMLPQLGDGITDTGGFYTQADMRAVVAHAASLGVEVMPEIDIPGHCAALLAARPELVDPDEPAESYHPVQGFPNNALNPAMPATWTVLEHILDELCALFPSPHFHIGGDEVAKGAWLASPQARILMQREGLAGTFELQSWFLTRVKKMLETRGKILVGWNEVAHGGGVPPENTVLMAWENAAVGIELAEQGYDVVMTPGQAYYLDMVQGADWLENGAGWAGPVPPQQSYEYEAEGDFPDHLRARMRGVQACIWSEHFTTKAWFNDLVFPRLSAMAEAAWTPAADKDWLRFARQVRQHPEL
ncbi:beta-N-acetylhexosaminidase [Falsirhodobacter sp. 1013]|uniref:beta-N-acetylhexosaminidase n=1 Tax=Falsirhodobacter sp. 1013 TaxID=3417566 RepID=UPI003EC05E48